MRAYAQISACGVCERERVALLATAEQERVALALEQLALAARCCLVPATLRETLRVGRCLEISWRLWQRLSLHTALKEP